MSSRLFQEIREKRGMAYSVYSYSSQCADAGQVGVYVGTREDNLAECLEIAVAELGPYWRRTSAVAPDGLATGVLPEEVAEDEPTTTLESATVTVAPEPTAKRPTGGSRPASVSACSAFCCGPSPGRSAFSVGVS